MIVQLPSPCLATCAALALYVQLIVATRMRTVTSRSRNNLRTEIIARARARGRAWLVKRSRDDGSKSVHTRM